MFLPQDPFTFLKIIDGSKGWHLYTLYLLLFIEIRIKTETICLYLCVVYVCLSM